MHGRPENNTRNDVECSEEFRISDDQLSIVLHIAFFVSVSVSVTVNEIVSTVL